MSDKVLSLDSVAVIRDWVKGQAGGVQVTVTSVTLTSAGWSSNTQTVSVSGVTASNTVIATYAPAYKSAYVAADIYCSAQGSGTLTFSCTTAPSSAVDVNIMIIDGTITPAVTYNITTTACDVYASFDGTTLSDQVTEAEAGETLYVRIPPSYNLTSSPTVSFTSVAVFTQYSVDSFTMPASDISITASSR